MQVWTEAEFAKIVYPVPLAELNVLLALPLAETRLLSDGKEIEIRLIHPIEPGKAFQGNHCWFHKCRLRVTTDLEWIKV